MPFQWLIHHARRLVAVSDDARLQLQLFKLCVLP